MTLDGQFTLDRNLSPPIVQPAQDTGPSEGSTEHCLPCSGSVTTAGLRMEDAVLG